MHHASTEQKPSGIPRLSRLPLPSNRSTRMASPGNEPTMDLTVQKQRRPAPQSRLRVDSESQATNKDEDDAELGRVGEASEQYNGEQSPHTHAVQISTGALTADGEVARRGTGFAAQQSVEHTGSGIIGAPASAPRLNSSLAERTMQTISQIPPSPSPRRRRFSFYKAQTPIAPPADVERDARLLPRLTNPTAGRISASEMGSPLPKVSGRRVSGAGARAMSLSLKNTNSASTHVQPRARPQSASANRGLAVTAPARRDRLGGPRMSAQISGYRSTGPSSLRPRPSQKCRTTVNVSPSEHAASLPKQTASKTRAGTSSKPLLHKRSSHSVDGDHGDQPVGSESPSSKSQKSSAALREAIAKAKALKKRAAGELNPRSITAQSPASRADDTSMGTLPDSCNLSEAGFNGKSLLARIASARDDGRLDISAMALGEIPDEALNMYGREALGSSRSAWYESVDLTRFSAADNELKTLDPRLFPEVDSLDDVDEEVPIIFGSLEGLDLHGNLLRALPVGIRSLQNLVTLNLSHNKLTSDCLPTIFECTSLRDLNLAHNILAGEVDVCISKLANLVTINLSNNLLRAVPAEVGSLAQLRTLDLSYNDMSELPYHAVADLRLTNLNVSNNKFRGPLVERDSHILNTLQTLNLSNNSLTLLAESSPCRFIALRELDFSKNRLASLPDLSGWDELLTMDVSGNQLSSIPAGFTSLAKIRKASFRDNEIRELDNSIGLMESLESLYVSGNPLRSKKALKIPTEDLKTYLRSQIEPETEDVAEGSVATLEEKQDFGGEVEAGVEGQEIWPVQPGGVLDRSSAGLEAVELSVLKASTRQQAVMRLVLHHNLLSSIPDALSVLATTVTEIDLSHNKLDSDMCLSGPLSLPNLLHLNLSCNAIRTLSPLADHLSAARLRTLDVSANGLSALVPLRQYYPALTSLTADENSITEIDVEHVRGLEFIGLSNNDIGRLPPRLGLLEEIRRLEVGGNRFKVPSWSVLRRGTPAVLAWLKDKIPAGERDDRLET